MGICCSNTKNNKNKANNLTTNTSTSEKANSKISLPNDKNYLITYESIKTYEYIFNLQNDKVEIIAEEDLETPIEFFIRVFNFKISLSSLIIDFGKYFFIEVQFLATNHDYEDSSDEADEKKELFKMTKSLTNFNLSSRKQNSQEFKSKNIYSSIFESEKSDLKIDRVTLVRKLFTNLTDPYIKIVSL
jgi:hypothetical protein